MFERRVPVALVWILTMSATGCAPTPEKIAGWKGTQKGPQKLRETVESTADAHVRALAVAALVEIGLGNDATQALAKATPADRNAIAHEVTEPLAALLGESASHPVPTSPVQRAAKDALFQARGDADVNDRKRIDTLLIGWTTADLATRSSLGGESTEKILRAIGASAAPALVPLVRQGPDLMTAAHLIGELGDRDTKDKAAAQLIAVIRSGPGRLERVPEPPLQALGLVGGEAATRFLLEVAHQGGVEAREKALYALGQGSLSAGNATALEGAGEIAADAHAPGKVREAAFEVMEKMGPPAVTAITKSFADHDSTVRFRAFEAAVKAGGIAGVSQVLAAWPEDRAVKNADLDDFMAHDLVALGHDAVSALAKAAHTVKRASLGQIAAIRALAQLAKKADGALLDDLVDLGEVCGKLTPPTRVGDEAKRARDTIVARK